MQQRCTQTLLIKATQNTTGSENKRATCGIHTEYSSLKKPPQSHHSRTDYHIYTKWIQVLVRLSNINDMTGDDEAFERLASDYEDEEEEEDEEDPESTGAPRGSAAALDQAESDKAGLEHVDDHAILALDAGTATTN